MNVIAIMSSDVIWGRAFEETFDICDTAERGRWEPKILESFVIFVNMQTQGHGGSKSSSGRAHIGCNERPGREYSLLCLSEFYPHTRTSSSTEDICLNFWLLNHRQFGKVFINKVRDPWNEFSEAREGEREPCDENKMLKQWELLRKCRRHTLS